MSLETAKLLNRKDQQLETALYKLMDAVQRVFGPTSRMSPLDGDGGYLLIFGRQIVLVGENSEIVSEGGPFEVLNDLQTFETAQETWRQGVRMKPPYYKVEAYCVECGMIKVDRKTATYTSTSGAVREKASVRCPNCGLWAGIVKMEKVEA
jgi:hypothetical protein